MHRLPILLVALIFAGSAIAHHQQDCEPTTFTSPYTYEVGPYYVVNANDECWDICYLALWVYEESNGINGLQRNDESVDNTCHGKIPSDSVIF